MAVSRSKALGSVSTTAAAVTIGSSVAETVPTNFGLVDCHGVMRPR